MGMVPLCPMCKHPLTVHLGQLLCRRCGWTSGRQIRCVGCEDWEQAWYGHCWWCRSSPGHCCGTRWLGCCWPAGDTMRLYDILEGIVAVGSLLLAAFFVALWTLW